MNVSGLCVVCAGSLLVATGLAAPRSVDAAGHGCIPGSYLAVEASGTQSLWTFSSDGTFQVASSAERAFKFSHIQGTWQRQGAHDVRAVGLDFGLPSDPTGAGAPPAWITRIDMSLRFSRDCQRFAGGFELRFYNATEEPLEAPTTAPAGADTLTARRIQVPDR
jgi:hypothetical protein